MGAGIRPGDHRRPHDPLQIPCCSHHRPAGAFPPSVTQGSPILVCGGDRYHFSILYKYQDYVKYGFLSGTYTFDTHFQYYNLDNVVLNITEGTPPNLTKGVQYKFTVMDVSEDNWVNTIFVAPFIAE